MYKKLDLLMRAGGVQRYHQAVGIDAQSVAEHTWRAMVIADTICEHEHHYVPRALMYHDIDELITGDIPSPVKWAEPEIKRLADKMGVDFRKRNELPDQPNLIDAERRVYSLADKLEGMFYCLEQRQAGRMRAAVPFCKFAGVVETILGNWDGPTEWFERASVLNQELIVQWYKVHGTWPDEEECNQWRG